MKWFGLLVAGIALWVLGILGRVAVAGTVFLVMALSFFIAMLYHDAMPVLAAGVVCLAWLSSRRGGDRGTSK